MLTPIVAFTLLPFVDVIRSPHRPGVRFALDSPLEEAVSSEPVSAKREIDDDSGVIMGLSGS